MTIRQINCLVRLLWANIYSAGLPEVYPGIGISGETTGPGVAKNRPNSFWDQTRYPTMTTKVGFQANLDYNIPQYEVDFKPNNATRDQTSVTVLVILEYKVAQNKFNEGFANVSGLSMNPNNNPNNNMVACVNEEVL